MAMEVTWYGTASIRIDIQKLSLLFDPFVPLPGADYTLPVAGFLPAPYIFITHGHLDHLRSIPQLVGCGAGEVFATATPCATLMGQGVPRESVHRIEPGGEVRFSAAEGCLLDSGTAGPPEAGGDTVTVRAVQGRHIRFDVPLVLATLASPRIVRYADNVATIRRDNKVFLENHETVVYEASYGGLRVTLMGSLALADDGPYTPNPDLLVLPYQGHSRLELVALPIIERLMPRAVLLDHFDDPFPPVSHEIDTAPLVEAMAQRHPGIRVIVPERGVAYPVA